MEEPLETLDKGLRRSSISKLVLPRVSQFFSRLGSSPFAFGIERIINDELAIENLVVC